MERPASSRISRTEGSMVPTRAATVQVASMRAWISSRSASGPPASGLPGSGPPAPSGSATAGSAPAAGPGAWAGLRPATTCTPGAPSSPTGRDVTSPGPGGQRSGGPLLLQRIRKNPRLRRWPPPHCSAEAIRASRAEQVRAVEGGGHGGHRPGPVRSGLRAAPCRRPAPLPDVQDRGVRDRHRHAGAHPRDAPRVRRRPHLGHRQHHPQAHDRGQAADRAWASSSRSATPPSSSSWPSC